MELHDAIKKRKSLRSFNEIKSIIDKGVNINYLNNHPHHNLQ